MSLVDKLKVKPVPLSKANIVIKLAKPKVDVNIKAKIVDKRSSDMDREQLLVNIKKRKKESAIHVNSQVPIRPSIKRTSIASKPPKDPKESTGEPKIKKPKKTRKRLKLVGIDKGTISTVGQPRDINPEMRKTKKPKLKIVSEGSVQELVIGDIIKKENLPKEQQKVTIKASAYYLNNRKIFVEFINNLFSTYREEILKEQEEYTNLEGDIMETKCNKGSDDTVGLFSHQKIVRDYLNLYTPYRGLLLYHGLGSGKTCASIAIAEGMKSEKKIIVMTPASLRQNYIEELKHCGDLLYKKNQYWEFIPHKGDIKLTEELSTVLSLSEDYITKQDGAWLVNINKAPNYETLTSSDKSHLEKQLNEMIRNKYQFISYNGLRLSHLNTLSADGNLNPFDNSVVIIDEAHNFISRIVNKLRKPDSLSMKLYEYLMSAEDCRIVLLTGTPIINYPNEVGILFNILRGYIKTWTIPLTVKSAETINEKKIQDIIKNSESKYIIDFITYRPSTKILTVTKNPYGFASVHGSKKYEGVKLDKSGNVNDETMISLLSRSLSKHNIEIVKSGISVSRFKALPDNLDEFKEFFIKIATGEIKNKMLFQRRILGLTSYLGSIEDLLPKYDSNSDFHVIKIPMSDYQFTEYEQARAQERKIEKSQKKPQKKGKDGSYEEASSTYRIFSRLFCNYVFPNDLVKRPMPNEGANIETAIKNMNEDVIDNTKIEQRINDIDGKYTADDITQLKESELEIKDISYEQRLHNALKLLKENEAQYFSKEALDIYSRKFLNILENIQDPDHVGLHLIYSQFRTLEGIGILKLVLEANGFAEFKIKKNGVGLWELDIKPGDLAKPKFALYTGTEDVDTKEIIRNIYNSSWQYVPTTIVEQLKKLSGNNNLGDIIKVLMITASGAEGISLRNCRYVHICEPYWHPVRTEQVIGRARRICSHKDLPVDLRTVKVFMYLMTFTEDQIKSDVSIELRLKDVSKTDKKTPLTSDEALFEIANIKSEINKQLLTAIKETAFDCALHSTSSSKEKLLCFSFGKVPTTKFTYTPSLVGEEKDTVTKINLKTLTWKAKELKYSGKKYALRVETGEVYDYDSYKQALKTPGLNPTFVGKLEKTQGKFKLTLL